jgi:hypothetical protein
MEVGSVLICLCDPCSKNYYVGLLASAIRVLGGQEKNSQLVIERSERVLDALEILLAE